MFITLVEMEKDDESDAWEDGLTGSAGRMGWACRLAAAWIFGIWRASSELLLDLVDTST